jgi:hypothetical protein
MERAISRHVERVARLAGDDLFGERVAQAPAAGFNSRGFLLDIDDAVQRVVDAVIAGAAAQIALQHAWQLLARLRIEGRGGHDHAGGAEAALKGLRIEKGLLHRVQLAAEREPFDGGDLAPGAAEGSTRQEWRGTPSSQMVQAPQSPWSQPFLTPKQPSSRRKVLRHCPGAGSAEKDLPFTAKFMPSLRVSRARRESARHNNR